MFSKISKITFIVLFLSMLTVPLLTTNLKKNTISVAENRTLAQMPELYNKDGTRNLDFNNDFELWINDNIGFRSNMVTSNAKMQYYLFNLLPNNSDMYLGPNGEFNYAVYDMLKDYQHLNLYSEEHLDEMADSYQYISDYLEAQGKQFYYYQCWDKHSIYPEYFPDTVIQHGETSKTDGIVSALKEKTSVNVISSKQTLIDKKADYDTYSRWGDAAHWTQRGAYIGYLELMDAINSNNGNKYRVLKESDYNITVTDQGSTIFGCIHKEDMLENFDIKKPKAVLTNEKLSLYNENRNHKFFTNNHVDNDTRVLILGDSYFDVYILDDIAESFYETLIIWGDYSWDIGNIIEEYHPDIVISENAERCDRTYGMIDGVKAIKKKQ